MHGGWWMLGAVLLAFSTACGQTVDVTASLDATDGWARPGAYVPVRLRATNRTSEALAEVRVQSGGPVEVAAPWRLAPGATGEIVLPVAYVGGDLALAVEFVVEGAGRRTIPGAVARPTVRPLPSDGALVAVGPGLPEPDDAIQKKIREALGAKSLHLLHLTPEALVAAERCGMLDAIVSDDPPAAHAGRAVLVRSDGSALPAPSFPLGVQEPVQPEAYRLFASNVWPAADRRRLWLGLAVFALAVLVVAALTPRRRWLVAAAGMTAMAAAGVAVVWFYGDVQLARLREARVFYVHVLPEHARAAVEHFALLETRGGAVARFPLPRGGARPLPLPVLAESEDLFRTSATLHYGAEERVECSSPASLFHILEKTDPPFGVEVEEMSRAGLEALASRPDVIRALLVEGARATDAAGRTQTLDAWAVEWRAGEDPDVAYAGRSLTWWSRQRQEGDGPAILAWWHDSPAVDAAAGQEVLRLPALVVYSAGPPP